MSDQPHPLRRKKHRRGKRSGKKHALPVAKAEPLPPTVVASLRSRLSRLKVSHG